MTDITPLDADGAPEEVVPDYSRLGFRQLRALCKDRNIPADGTVVDLIDKLKAWDAQHGRDVDTTVPDVDDEEDLLADPADDPAPETSTGGGAAASVSPPPDGLNLTPPPQYTTTTGGAGVTTVTVGDLPGIGQPPAVGTTPEYPAATQRGGRPNLATTSGVVTVGEGQNAQHGTVLVRAYRAEYVIGTRDITDQDHFGYLEQTHQAAQRAGYATKGGVTIGERVGYGVKNGQRTAIYQVPLRRAD